jgi:crotonobetainyl-CoA:carnitine CoA-transferase CaiB-like acyl-CoA transferase
MPQAMAIRKPKPATWWWRSRTLGKVRTPGPPVKFSQFPGKVRSGAPIFGEHTAEVLRDSGFDTDKIAALQKQGAISAARV